MPRPVPTVTELRWRDPPLAEIDAPKGKLKLTCSVGSGLGRRAGDMGGRVWGLGDRGPNIKLKVAIKDYGLDVLKPHKGEPGAKMFPLPNYEPMLTELQVGEGRVERVRDLPLRWLDRTMNGRPLPGGDNAEMEPAYDITGQNLPSSPDGCDPEGVAVLADGSFWVSEEYGPSILRVGADGVVRSRWVPEGLDLAGADPCLPARALRRRLNRGFEGLCVSADEQWLFVTFQSGLEGEDPRATLIWKLAAADGSLAAEYVYPFDAPDTFPRDHADGEADLDGLKVCELVWLDADRLLVLERITRDARLYVVDVSRPGRLAKTLVFSTDDHPEVIQDLEGVALLSDREALLVSDNDFAVEGAETRFYRLAWPRPL